MKELHERKNIRLENYDYSQNGAYFVTICVKNKHEMLGRIVGAIINRPQNPGRIVGAIINRPQPQKTDRTYIELSEHGVIVDKALNEIPIHYANMVVDKYVVMPNHIHLILIICNFDNSGRLTNNSGRLIIAPTTSISTVIQQLKRCVSKQLGFSLWQKSFYDHIIRDETEYRRIWQYIDENPERWHEDEYYIR